MRLAQPHAAVDEQRVVGAAGVVRHRQRRGVGEGIGAADHEILERVVRVEHGALHFPVLVLDLLGGEDLDVVGAPERRPQHVGERLEIARPQLLHHHRVLRLDDDGFFRDREQLQPGKPGFEKKIVHVALEHGDGLFKRRQLLLCIVHLPASVSSKKVFHKFCTTVETMMIIY